MKCNHIFIVFNFELYASINKNAVNHIKNKTIIASLLKDPHACIFNVREMEMNRDHVFYILKYACFWEIS
jgi:hypothetical protein